MAYIQELNVNIQVLPQSDDYTIVTLSQNENGRRLRFHILGVEIPSGSTASISGTKPDGVVYSNTGTVSGDYVTIDEDIQLTAVAGTWDAKIRVINGGNSIATAIIRFEIEKDPVEEGSVPSDSEITGLVAQAAAYAEDARSAAYGSPLTAATVADMIDQTRVYVYTGSETGYTAGHWYYYNGSAWTDGGVYNSSALQLDDTLSIAGLAPDSKVVGDTLNSMYTDPNNDGNIVITTIGD